MAKWSKSVYEAADEAHNKALSENPNDQTNALSKAVDAALHEALTNIVSRSKMVQKLKPLVWARQVGRTGERGEQDWDTADVAETLVGTYKIKADWTYPSGKINGYYIEVNDKRFGSHFDLFKTRDEARDAVWDIYKKYIMWAFED